METFIARQPIFDRHQSVYAYELLFRSSLENVFGGGDPDQATSRVIVDGYFNVGLETITNGKPAFINMTADVLVKDFATLLSPHLTVIEILETVEATEEVVAACWRLREAGFTIALDDFEDTEASRPLIEVAHIIKVDFVESNEEERKSFVERFAPMGKQLLAEKVETPEEFQEAADLGYSLFQGYFFAKPKVISTRAVPALMRNYLRILQEVQRPNLEYKKMEQIIKEEVSLCYKFLRLCNSSFYGLKQEITSIRLALALLGEKAIRKWISLITTASMGRDKPQELIVQALIRAKFCEEFAVASNRAPRSDECFIMGLVSLMDAVLGQTLEDLLKDLPVSESVKDSLLEEKGPLRPIYDYVCAYERGDWSTVARLEKQLNATRVKSSDIYMQSLAWAQTSVTAINEGVTTPESAV